VDGGFYVTNYLRYRAFNYSTTPGAVRTRKWREKAKRHGDVTDVTGASRGDAKPVTVTSRSASASALCFSSLRERGKGESKKGVNHRDADDDTNLDKALEEARADEPRLDAELERKMKAA
jgi:hypothetical protein